MDLLNAFFEEYYEVILLALALILAFGFVRFLVALTIPAKKWLIRTLYNPFAD